MSLAFVLDHRADVDPEGDADPGESASLTNEQLLGRVRAACRHLRDLGVRPGDIVALQLTDRLELMVVLFAAWRLGAAVMPIHSSVTDDEVDRQLNGSNARVLVTDDGTTAPAGIATLAVGRLCRTIDWPDLLVPPDPTALALVIYPNGSSRVLARVMLDHSDVDAMVDADRIDATSIVDAIERVRRKH
jgi:long-chain acyl-CoA synthetase